MKRPCVFFDRDGVVNTAPPPEEYYVLSVARFFIEPGFIKAMHVLREKGWPAVIVTNQKCVHKGLITLEAVDAIHQHLKNRLAEEGLSLLDIYVCPHGDGHPDRKPNPGMLLRAAEEHDLNLADSWMIGDTKRDMKAADAAGLAWKVQVGPEEVSPLANSHVESMDDLPAYLTSNLKNRISSQ